jgi:RNA polymerase sigma-70 factor (ECF subfamily)
LAERRSEPRRFEAKSSLRTWIYAILGNCARRRAAQEQRLVPLSELAADEASGDDLGVSRDRFFDEGRWAGMWSSAVPRWDGVPEERLVSSPQCSKRSRRCRECREQ